MLCGGVGAAQDATAEVQALCDGLKEEVLAKAQGTMPGDEFVAVRHKTQVVAGTNFFVKIRVGGDRHVHARIYRDLGGKASLHGVQVSKSAEDPIEYF